jgi:hypothetical protein
MEKSCSEYGVWFIPESRPNMVTGHFPRRLVHPPRRSRHIMLSSLRSAAAGFWGGVVALGAAIKLYQHYPRTGKLHAWQHNNKWWLHGQVKRYRGVDGRFHTGFFCTDCGELIVHEDRATRDVEPAPWPATMPAHEAEALFYHVAYARTWRNKWDNDARLRYCRWNPEFDAAVRRELLAHGYTEADLERSHADDWQRWLDQTLSLPTESGFGA